MEVIREDISLKLRYGQCQRKYADRDFRRIKDENKEKEEQVLVI